MCEIHFRVACRSLPKTGVSDHAETVWPRRLTLSSASAAGHPEGATRGSVSGGGRRRDGGRHAALRQLPRRGQCPRGAWVTPLDSTNAGHDSGASCPCCEKAHMMPADRIFHREAENGSVCQQEHDLQAQVTALLVRAQEFWSRTATTGVDQPRLRGVRHLSASHVQPAVEVVRAALGPARRPGVPSKAGGTHCRAMRAF
jgi:hypothetical protein